MSFLKSIFASLFAIIAGLLIVLSLIIVTPIYFVIFLLGGNNSDRKAHNLSRIWAWYVLFCSGTRIKVYGRSNINPNETYVFISNHRSYLDIPVCARATKNIFKFLAKDELGKLPLLGYIIRKLYITVRRQSMRDRVLSLRKMEAELNKGISVWIYPEGTRNTTYQALTDFNDGAFTVAINTGKPIAVCTIYDTAKILKPGKLFQLFPGKVEVFWEQPIETKGLQKKDIPLLKEQVRNIMINRIKALGVYQ